MRRAFIALAVTLGAATLVLLPAAARAFVSEEVRLFPSQGPQVAVVRVLSTTDISVFAPLIAAYQTRNPGVAVDYTVASSQEVFAAIDRDHAAFDVAISSAMDEQVKLANDGLARRVQVTAAAGLPHWAEWQGRVFAFSQEPVVTLVSQSGLAGLPLPRTRRDLTALLRDHPDRFRDRVGTYDIRKSGAGYLFATQEARQSDSFWRLAEVMGTLHPRLYSSTADMISDLKDGKLILAYNVLGSYAAPQFPPGADGAILELDDFTLTLLRTALVPSTAQRPDLGAGFIDFLLGSNGQRLINKAGLPPLDESALDAAPQLRPIRLDSGLLVYLDRIKRFHFLEEWSAALVQP